MQISNLIYFIYIIINIFANTLSYDIFYNNLARFLQIDKPICQPYIRAALITLFKNYKFCRCAKSMNYSEIILNKIQVSNYSYYKLLIVNSTYNYYYY